MLNQVPNFNQAPNFSAAPNFAQAPSPPPNPNLNQSFNQAFAQHPSFQEWQAQQYQAFLLWQKQSNMGPYAKGFWSTLGGVTVFTVVYAGFVIFKAIFGGKSN
jgi:hypothetical protein